MRLRCKISSVIPQGFHGGVLMSYGRTSWIWSSLRGKDPTKHRTHPEKEKIVDFHNQVLASGLGVYTHFSVDSGFVHWPIVALRAGCHKPGTRYIVRSHLPKRFWIPYPSSRSVAQYSAKTVCQGVAPNVVAQGSFSLEWQTHNGCKSAFFMLFWIRVCKVIAALYSEEANTSLMF